MSFFNNQSSIFACSANEYSSSRVSREEGGNVADKKAGLLTRDHAAHNNSISWRMTYMLFTREDDDVEP